MTWIQSILILVAGVNFGMSLVIFLKNKVNKSNKIFSFVLLFTALWSISLWLYYAYPHTIVDEVSFRLENIVGLFLAYFLYLFTFNYPFPSLHNIKEKKFIILLLILSILIFIFDNRINPASQSIILSSPELLIPTVLATLLFIRIFINLYYKYRNSSGNTKFQILPVLVGIMLPVIATLFFNVLGQLFNFFELSWIAPSSTIVMNSILMKVVLTKES